MSYAAVIWLEVDDTAAFVPSMGASSNVLYQPSFLYFSVVVAAPAIRLPSDFPTHFPLRQASTRSLASTGGTLGLFSP